LPSCTACRSYRLRHDALASVAEFRVDRAVFRKPHEDRRLARAKREDDAASLVDSQRVDYAGTREHDLAAAPEREIVGAVGGEACDHRLTGRRELRSATVEGRAPADDNA